MWRWHDDDGWAWVVMTIGMVAMWALVAVAIVVGLRALGGVRDRSDDPETLLGRRFASGEIDESEYRSRLAALRSARSGRR
jgi:putative membrane protein